jgi:8-oxo-dGTP diphosphatase
MPIKNKAIKTIHVAIGCLIRPLPTKAATEIDEQIPTTASDYQVLLVRRREKQLPEIDNMWELPGGKIEPRESPDKAVEREFLEETGYVVKATNCLDRIFTVVREYPEFRQDTYITCYRCELRIPLPNVTKLDSKIGEIRWFDPNDLDYFKILAGSREFIIDVALSLNIPIQPDLKKLTALAIFEVVNDDSAKRQKRLGRKYVLVTQFDPLSDQQYILVTHRSGLHRHAPDEIELFMNHEQMIRRAQQKAARRFYNGYVLTYWDENFPLLQWFKVKNYPMQKMTHTQTYDIQLRLPLFKQKDDDES